MSSQNTNKEAVKEGTGVPSPSFTAEKSSESKSTSSARSSSKSQIPILLTAVFLAYFGQMTLNPIIAPLAREMGLAEWQIGVTISVAAIMVVVTSQFWGRRSQSWGCKKVLVAAFAVATTTMAFFAALSEAGMRGILTGGVLFAFFVLFRGIGFGSAISAVLPTSQAYVARVTDDEETRVKGMAGIGAVQGIAMVAGAVMGGTLSVFGLIAPIVAVPLLLGMGLILIIFVLRKEPQTELIKNPAHIKPNDSRVWPFLLSGFGMFTALGFIQVIAGFIVQDRFGLDAATTGLVTGGVLLAAGIGMIISQSIIVPRSSWAPATLLRVGSLVGFCGFMVMIPSIGIGVFIISVLLVGLGLGIAMPGYTAGPTLLVKPDEQGGLAGLIGATNGLTFVIAPTASTVLYGIWGTLPIIVGGAIMGFVACFVLLHPRFRKLKAQGEEASS